MKECPKSPNGKHDWTFNDKKDFTGNYVHYRKCDYCHLKQKRQIVNPLTGCMGWVTIQPPHQEGKGKR
jgi:hypothetical protein